jgi:hypothetical protein
MINPATHSNAHLIYRYGYVVGLCVVGFQVGNSRGLEAAFGLCLVLGILLYALEQIIVRTEQRRWAAAQVKPILVTQTWPLDSTCRNRAEHYRQLLIESGNTNLVERDKAGNPAFVHVHEIYYRDEMNIREEWRNYERRCQDVLDELYRKQLQRYREKNMLWALQHWFGQDMND